MSTIRQVTLWRKRSIIFITILQYVFALNKNSFNRLSEVQEARNSSKSKKPAKYTDETRHLLETGLLRYEMDIYRLIQAIFYEKLQYFNIPLQDL